MNLFISVLWENPQFFFYSLFFGFTFYIIFPHFSFLFWRKPFYY